MSELAWRFFRWMCEPSKLYRRRFFFRITPRWLSGKLQMYMVRCFAERYPDEMERKIREALQPFGATRSEAMTKNALDLILHPRAYKRRLSQAHKRRISQIGPHP